MYELELYEDKFELWREAVGFESGFPRLRALAAPVPAANNLSGPSAAVSDPDSRRFFMNQLHRDKLQEIYESLGSQSKIVVTAPGHGATTTARYIYELARRETLIRRSIPVLVSLEDLIEAPYDQLAAEAVEFLKKSHQNIGERKFGAASYSRSEGEQSREDDDLLREIAEEHLEDLRDDADDLAQSHLGKISAKRWETHIGQSIRSAVIRSLSTQPWERVIKATLYRDLIGCVSPTREAFVDRRKELGTYLAGQQITDAQWQQIETISPVLGNSDYEQLIRDLNKAGQVRISLILDLSASPVGRQFISDEHGEYLTEPYSKAIQNVSKAIKNIEQKAAGGPQPVLPSLLDKLYILSTAAWGIFQADHSAQEDDVITVPHFRPIDVWAMLAQHYPPRGLDSGRRSEVLAAVLDASFIEINAVTALSTEMGILEHQLRSELEKETDVRYHRARRDPNSQEQRRRLEAMQEEIEALKEEFARRFEEIGS